MSDQRVMISPVSGGLRGNYHDIGSAMHMNGAEIQQALEWTTPAIVSDPLVPSKTGVAKQGWRLGPSSLPDQLWTERRCGRVRSISSGDDAYVRETDLEHPGIAGWQALIESRTPVEVPPDSHIRVLWDLEDYYCGYPEIGLSGGKNASTKILWAEGLFEDDARVVYPRIKGDRNIVLDKRFYGFGDAITQGGAPTTYRPLWWRSGRYVLLDITTADEPLTVESLSIIETRYPVENDGTFTSSDPSIDKIIPLAVRGIQMCSHETFMDCPYYEQLMYVGDTRLEMLTTYTMSGDSALAKRGIELFDWSRHSNGFVADQSFLCPGAQIRGRIGTGFWRSVFGRPKRAVGARIGPGIDRTVLG